MKVLNGFCFAKVQSETPVQIKGGKDMNENRFLPMTLVLKAVNRRKHNSQEWMFKFAQELHARRQFAMGALSMQSQQKMREEKDDMFVFLTDCGTLFEEKCVLRLTAYMLDHRNCVGCTGRQRVMSALDQDCPDEGLPEKLLRQVQSFDYESSYAYATGTFSLLGMLPVLPGPCCMLRFLVLIKKRDFRQVDPLNDLLNTPFSQTLAKKHSSPQKGQSRLSMNTEEDLTESVLSVDAPPEEMLMESLWTEGVRPIRQSAWEHFSQIVATDATQTNGT